MKALSIIGILISLGGIALAVINWVLFTLQIPGTYSETITNSGGHVIEYNGSLTHHEHSITLLIVLIICFLFFLAFSIFGLTVKRKTVRS